MEGLDSKASLTYGPDGSLAGDLTDGSAPRELDGRELLDP